MAEDYSPLVRSWDELVESYGTGRISCVCQRYPHIFGQHPTSSRLSIYATVINLISYHILWTPQCTFDNQNVGHGSIKRESIAAWLCYFTDLLTKLLSRGCYNAEFNFITLVPLNMIPVAYNETIPRWNNNGSIWNTSVCPSAAWMTENWSHK